MTNHDIAGKGRGASSPALRKMLLQALIGGICGAGAMVALMSFVKAGGSALKSPDHVVALTTGVVYVLMGVFVGLGASLPRLGARLLNVEDAAEVRDQRRDLMAGSVTTILLGAAVIALALTPGDGSVGVISRTLSGILVGASIISLVVVGILFRIRQDELTRLLVLESMALTAKLVGALLGGWAVLAHLGWAQMFTPLAFVAGSLALFLLSTFIAAGRRGMLKPPSV